MASADSRPMRPWESGRHPPTATVPREPGQKARPGPAEQPRGPTAWERATPRNRVAMTRLRVGAPVTAPQNAPERGMKPAPSTSGEPVLKPTGSRPGSPCVGKPRGSPRGGYHCPAVTEKRRFCSPSSIGKQREGKYAGENNRPWQGGKVTQDCEFCDDEYEVTPAKAEDSRFCSPDCLNNWKGKHKTGQDNRMWRGGGKIGESVKKQLHGPSWRKIRNRGVGAE